MSAALALILALAIVFGGEQFAIWSAPWLDEQEIFWQRAGGLSHLLSRTRGRSTAPHAVVAAATLLVVWQDDTRYPGGLHWGEYVPAADLFTSDAIDHAVADEILSLTGGAAGATLTYRDGALRFVQHWTPAGGWDLPALDPTPPAGPPAGQPALTARLFLPCLWANTLRASRGIL